MDFFEWVWERQPALCERYVEQHRLQPAPSFVSPDKGLRVLIGIPTCHKFTYGKWESKFSPNADLKNKDEYGSNHPDDHFSGLNGDRVQALRDTWLKDVAALYPQVTYKLFYGSPHTRTPKDDEVFLGCGDTYADLPQKTICVCQYAYQNGFDFLFKADDDTGVRVERLYSEILTMITKRHDYAGNTQGRMCNGGAGYILSRKALEVIVHNPVPTHWAEDWTVSQLLAKGGISPINLPGHRKGSSGHWYFPNGFDPKVDMTGVVTFNAVQPQVLRDWYAHEGMLILRN